MPKLYYASPRDLPVIEPHPGVKGRVVHAQYATLVVYDYAPKTIVETHKHDVEQVGVVVKGSLAMVIAGEQRILMPGDSFRIPARTAHGARVFEEPTMVIDVYAPPRGDLGQPAEVSASTAKA
ncbi:MAG TPA: cupin domain-containing protein [Candidatus Limnocylindria bacterium]|nr:cupin domain-containing protein [Candidatus Limnocylindria bacterium]